ncbi:MAG TPA: T9SS type A sorting domain-containing protein [Bacteroidia bacterium]|nr:T9SS type A sorting domain-containing protein [Bacteroidia bacterium]
MKHVKFTRTCICLFAFLFLQIATHAQTPPCQWASDIGGGSVDAGLSVVTFYTGDVYITGKFSGPNVDFDPGAGVANLSSNGGTDIFVAKYDAAGQYQWAFNIGSASDDAGNSIALDIYGYVHVTGFYDGSNVDFDPSGNTVNLSSTGSNDIFLAKYSPAGQYEWAISIGGTAPDEGYSVALDDSEYVYLTGSLGSTNADFDPSANSVILNSNGGTDIFLARYSNSGQYMWAFNLGAAGNFNERGAAIACDHFANVYVTGQIDGTGNIDVDPSISTHSLTGGGSTDIFVVKYNMYGHYQWAFNIPGPNADAGAGICSDGWGNILVTGQFNGTNLDFDPGVGVESISSNASSTDAFVVSYTPAGQYNWAFALGSSSNNDGGTAVGWDDLGNAIVAGYFSATADFDPTSGVTNLTSSGMEDIYLAKYNNTGQYIWAFNVGNAGSDDAARGLSLTYGTNEPVITGDFDGTSIDFDPAAATIDISSSGAQDIFVAKYFSCWAPPATPLDLIGPSVVCAGATYVYSVSAVPQATGYTWTLPPGWGGNSNGTSITVTANTASGTITVTADNPCGSSPPATFTVTVSTPPAISYTQMPNTACVDDGLIAISPATPVGGTYSGPGVNGTTFNPFVAGVGYDTVTYTYIDSNGCFSSYPQVIHVSACVGILDFSIDDQVQIFPNPFDDQLTLIFSSQEKAQATVYNMLGEEVVTVSLINGTNTIDTQFMAPGFYVLKVITAEGVVERKLVKN